MLSDQENIRRYEADKHRKGLYELGHGIAWAGFWIGLGLVFIAYAMQGQL